MKILPIIIIIDKKHCLKNSCIDRWALPLGKFLESYIVFSEYIHPIA